MSDLVQEIKALTDLKIHKAHITELAQYSSVLLQINEHTNLTGAKNIKDFALKHVADVCVAAETYEVKHKWPSEIWDIGSGGGLPGIPLAILYKDIRVTLVERREKKAGILTEIVKACGLGERVQVICNSFELVKKRSPDAECWFRGFLPAEKMITYFSDHVPSDSLKRVVLMKGPSWSLERDDALAAKRIRTGWHNRFLNSTTAEYSLPESAGSRCLVFL